jgi:hypothetical protein
MTRAILLACLPWAALLVVLLACLYLLIRVNRSRIRLSRVFELHRDQVGGVQSLSFVLTLPFFIMLMLLIVQISQLMIATVVVHYSAYAGVRSAIVWIPANMLAPEGPNSIGASPFLPDLNAPDTTVPILDATDPGYGPADGGVTYYIDMSQYTPKQSKVLTAAGMALVPICPSRDLGLTVPSHASYASGAIETVYHAMVPSSTSNSRMPVRLQNKLAYAMQNSVLVVKFFHTNREPPIQWSYMKPYDPGQFAPNELAWADTITVTVYHNYALLPGAGRIVSALVPEPEDAPDFPQSEELYTCVLTASSTMQNEGEIPVIPYVHDYP